MISPIGTSSPYDSKYVVYIYICIYIYIYILYILYIYYIIYIAYMIYNHVYLIYNHVYLIYNHVYLIYNHIYIHAIYTSDSSCFGFTVLFSLTQVSYNVSQEPRMVMKEAGPHFPSGFPWDLLRIPVTRPGYDSHSHGKWPRNRWFTWVYQTKKWWIFPWLC